MSALASIAIATAAIAGGELVVASSVAGTAMMGESCAFGINAMGTFAFGAGPDAADSAEEVVVLSAPPAGRRTQSRSRPAQLSTRTR